MKASGGERLLHIAVLSAFAVAQPLFDLLGRDATFFVAHYAAPGDVLLFVAVLMLVPMAIVVALEAVAVLAGGLAQVLVRHAVVAGLVALTVLPPLERLRISSGWLVLGIAAVAGTIAALAYARWRPLRLFLTALSPAVLVFPLVFLLNPSVRRLVVPPEVGTTADARVATAAPVVMVVFDALPLNSLLDERERIDAVRYPHLARLAEHATWYRGATTVAQDTGDALPAILTGCYPTGEHRLPTAAEHPRNLFTLLGGVYDLHVHETLTELCPRSLCARETGARQQRAAMQSLLLDTAIVYAHLVLPDDIGARLPSIQERWTHFALPAAEAGRTGAVWHRNNEGVWGDRAASYMRFVDGIERSQRPTLHFLHIMLPHSPWTYFPSGRRTLVGAPGFVAVQGRWADEAAAREAELRHLLQVGFVDTLVGRLVERLQSTTLYDAAAIIVTADHGASFLPGQPHRMATAVNAADIVRVPLVVKAAGQREGRVSDRNVESIDLLPTLAELLGVDLPWPVDGGSALSGAARGDKTLVMQKEGRLRLPAVVAGGPGLGARFARFGAGTVWESLFARGPYAALVGTRSDAITEAGAKGFVVQRVRVWSEEVKAGSEVVPAVVEGALDVEDGGASGPWAAAVAVNGTIGAVVDISQTTGGAPGFRALVPDTLFHPGSNTLEVLAVRRSQ